MKNTNIIKRIKKDLNFLKSKIDKGEVGSILLYGSYVGNEQTKRSDIGICIVAPKLKTPKQFSGFLREVWQNMNANKYDVRLFEELPLYIKMEVIKNHRIILSRNSQNERIQNYN